MNKKYFIIKFISSLLIRASLLIIPIYYSHLIDSITMGNFKVAYQMVIMFFVFTMIYRLFEVINQITYYKLYSNLYKTYLDLGLYDTRLILILNGCFGVWNLMLARTYIQTTIPEELYEAAVLDGASHFQYFSKVVIPIN